MKATPFLLSLLSLLSLLASAALLLTGCDYDAPLTPVPTQKIDPRLLGDWVPAKKEDAKDPAMHVRSWDDTTYAIAIEDDIYRVWHSEFAGTAFVSTQDLNSAARKYCLYTWALSADATQLTLRRVRTEVVSDKAMTAAALQQAVKANLAHPQLLDDPLVFSHKPAR